MHSVFKQKNWVPQNQETDIGDLKTESLSTWQSVHLKIESTAIAELKDILYILWALNQLTCLNVTTDE